MVDGYEILQLKTQVYRMTSVEPDVLPLSLG